MKNNKIIKNKIFIIEDDINMLTSLQAKFSIEKFMISSSNGTEEINEIISKIKKFGAEFIILDLILPKFDGLSLLKVLKANDELSNIPVFIFSNLSDEDTKAKCYSLGAELYFYKKDFNIDEFITKIKKIINNKKSKK